MQFEGEARKCKDKLPCNPLALARMAKVWFRSCRKTVEQIKSAGWGLVTTQNLSVRHDISAAYPLQILEKRHSLMPKNKIDTSSDGCIVADQVRQDWRNLHLRQQVQWLRPLWTLLACCYASIVSDDIRVQQVRMQVWQDWQCQCPLACLAWTKLALHCLENKLLYSTWLSQVISFRSLTSQSFRRPIKTCSRLWSGLFTRAHGSVVWQWNQGLLQTKLA